MKKTLRSGAFIVAALLIVVGLAFGTRVAMASPMLGSCTGLYKCVDQPDCVWLACPDPGSYPVCSNPPDGCCMCYRIQ
jgi:hypothetical protein